MVSIQQMITGLRWTFTRIVMKHSDQDLEIIIKTSTGKIGRSHEGQSYGKC